MPLRWKDGHRVYLSMNAMLTSITRTNPRWPQRATEGHQPSTSPLPIRLRVASPERQRGRLRGVLAGGRDGRVRDSIGTGLTKVLTFPGLKPTSRNDFTTDSSARVFQLGNHAEVENENAQGRQQDEDEGPLSLPQSIPQVRNHKSSLLPWLRESRR